MLDRWLNVIAQRLGTYAAAVNAQRAAIEKERAGDEARDHAGREFVNPEGFTTPLPKNAQNKQNEYARARREYEAADLPRALAAAATLMIARERRDEAVAALKAHLDAEDLRKATGVHREVAPFFGDMFERGVEPRHLANVREETRAIISDLIRWDGHDSQMIDPESPMPAIFDLYASRLLLRPGPGNRSRSTPGAPTARVRYTDPEYYMFNELVRQPTTEASPELSAPASIDGTPRADDGGDPIASHQTAASIEVATVEQPETAGSMTPERAQAAAEAVFAADRLRMGIYWPKGIEQGDYDTGRLLPALEEWVAGPDTWSGAKLFLDAARRGEGREFIEMKRAAGIARFAAALIAGDQRALDEAHRAGAL